MITMARAPFSPGEKVEYGPRLYEIVRGPYGSGAYLLQLLSIPGHRQELAAETALTLADMSEWVPADEPGIWQLRPAVRHLAPRGTEVNAAMLCCGVRTYRLPGRDIVVGDPAKVDCRSRKPAVRHYCSLRDSPASGSQHTSGDGTPARKYCADCHGSLITEKGYWGVFRWRGDGRYPWEDAIATYTRPDIAHKRAVSSEARADDPIHGGWSVRWIPTGS